MNGFLARMFVAAVAAVATGLTPSVASAGSLFVTGHDADNHSNGDYQRAGLDFLTFGAQATPAEAATRSTVRVAYLANTNASLNGAVASGYTNRTFIDLDLSNWATLAFGGNYDILMIGSGFDYINATGSAELNSEAAAFATYFNNGGGIFVHTDEGRGQSFYNFLPSFGTTTNNTISTSGAFTATADGLAIGLTESIVDRDITHSYYTGVDTSVFKIFETYNNVNPKPAVAIGLFQGVIDDDGQFDTAVPEPTSMALLGMGAFGLIGARLRRKKADAAVA